MKWASITLGFFAILAFSVWFSTPEGVITPSGVVRIGGVDVRVMLADSPAARTQGLSGVSSLGSNEGMLFVFEEEGIHTFWMKDMLISIDILWFSKEGEVVHIEKSASPESYPTSFAPPKPARFVLEVPAGFSDTHRIKIGDRATLPQNLSL